MCYGLLRLNLNQTRRWYKGIIINPFIFVNTLVYDKHIKPVI